jgi:hypothetical protein
MSDTQDLSIDSSMGLRKKIKKCETEEIWLSSDEDIVGYLIIKQKFDGLWNLDMESIEKLTRKPFGSFQFAELQISSETLISAIIIVVFETRFTAFESLWHGVIRKARKRLTDLFEKDSKNLNVLLDKIHKQLCIEN